MPDELPEWLLKATSILDDRKQQIQNNRERIFDELEEIKGQIYKISEQVSHISVQLDESILVGIRTGLRHLVDGMNSQTKEVRNDELRLARVEFTKLICLNLEGVTRGTSGEIPNEFLIAFGYWGNFQYFNLKGEQRNALIQGYELTHKNPALGLSLFPSELFSKNYPKLIEAAKKELSEVIGILQERQGENFLQNLTYYSKQVLRGAATGIIGIGGLTIVSATGGWLTHIVGAVTISAYTSLKPAEPQLHDIYELEKRVQLLAEQLQKYLVEARDESAARLQELQKLNLENTQNVSVVARKFGISF